MQFKIEFDTETGLKRIRLPASTARKIKEGVEMLGHIAQIDEHFVVPKCVADAVGRIDDDFFYTPAEDPSKTAGKPSDTGAKEEVKK